MEMWHLGVDVCDFLYGTTLAGTTVLSGDHTSIRALAELLDELVFGVDDEGRIEGGERVTLHGPLLGWRCGSEKRGSEGEDSLFKLRLSTRQRSMRRCYQLQASPRLPARPSFARSC